MTDTQGQGGPAPAEAPHAPEPGDVRPGTGTLERPPSDRFARRGRDESGARPRLRRAALLGGAAALAVTASWVLLAGLADVSWGMIAVAVAGGWLIGSWSAYGGWGEAPHVPAVRLRQLAAGLALGAWVLGWIGTYLWTRAILPSSTLDLAGRIQQTPFTSWFAGLFGPVEALEVVVIAAMAWRAAR